MTKDFTPNWYNMRDPFYSTFFLTDILFNHDHKPVSNISDTHKTLYRVIQQTLKTFMINDINTKDRIEIEIVNHNIDHVNYEGSIDFHLYSLGRDFMESISQYAFPIYLVRFDNIIKDRLAIELLSKDIFYTVFNDGMSRYPSRILFVDVIDKAYSLLNTFDTELTVVKDMDTNKLTLKEYKDTYESFNQLSLIKDKDIMTHIHDLFLKYIPGFLETCYIISYIDTIHNPSYGGLYNLVDINMQCGYDDNGELHVDTNLDKHIYLLSLINLMIEKGCSDNVIKRMYHLLYFGHMLGSVDYDGLITVEDGILYPTKGDKDILNKLINASIHSIVNIKQEVKDDNDIYNSINHTIDFLKLLE